MQGNILIVGSGGQVGIELAIQLRNKWGADRVIASDVRPTENPDLLNGPFEILDIMDKNRLFEIVKKYNIRVIYQLAALLSATAEKQPDFAWRLNMEGLFNVLNLSKEGHIDKIFWPSSIAIFGPTTPKVMTPQHTISKPNTVYGISKIAGERWCEYYFEKYDVDVRSIRYPGLIGHRSLPGGGTTDYAVDIFHKAIQNGTYTCFLKEDTRLPMMYMDDAIRATMEITEAPKEDVVVRSSYNIAAMTFSPAELADKIKEFIPNFTINYDVDFRQKIADSWPQSIDDSEARNDWGWKEEFGLQELTEVMISSLTEKLKVG